MTTELELQPESRYIAPTSRCPFPARWRSADSESTEWEVSELVAGLVRGLQPSVVVETGTAFGQTTGMILDALERNDQGLLITCEADVVRRAAIRPHPRLVVLANSLSVELSQYAPLDFVFFDSFPELRVQEFRRYRQWMRPGTIVAFHDTADQASGGLGRAMREDVERLHIAMIHLPTPRGLTLGEIR